MFSVVDDDQHGGKRGSTHYADATGREGMRMGCGNGC